MAKYSEEFKWKVVMEYLHGDLGYVPLAKKYSIPSDTQILRWVHAYQALGEEGLKRKHSKQVYSVQFKLDVLNFRKQTGASLQETAIAFQMNNAALIANWFNTFQKEGIEGLQEKAKGRPSMSKNPKNKSTKAKKELTREEQLERDNELLRLENSYLKKLKAFQENPNAYLEKHKQRWYSNSTKKDSK